VRPYLKKTPSQKRVGGVMVQGIGLEFKHQYCKKKTKTYTEVSKEQFPRGTKYCVYV
jgi:hypothetical protein